MFQQLNRLGLEVDQIFQLQTHQATDLFDATECAVLGLKNEFGGRDSQLQVLRHLCVADVLRLQLLAQCVKYELSGHGENLCCEPQILIFFSYK